MWKTKKRGGRSGGGERRGGCNREQKNFVEEGEGERDPGKETDMEQDPDKGRETRELWRTGIDLEYKNASNVHKSRKISITKAMI